MTAENTPKFSLLSYLQIEHFMKMMMPCALVLFVFSLGSCSTESLDTESTLAHSYQNITALEAQVLDAVNQYRDSLGYTTLDFSDVAYQYANEHTDYMITSGSLNHDNFTARASNMSSQVNAEAIAENVAKDYTTASTALKGWLKSSEHKKTIEGDFTHTAVSVKVADNGSYYFTQLFYK